MTPIKEKRTKHQLRTNVVWTCANKATRDTDEESVPHDIQPCEKW